MTILVVEDDVKQSDHYLPPLKEGLPGITFDLIETASEFVEAIDKYEKAPPVFIIMDVMLPWSWTEGMEGKFLRPDNFDPERAGLFLLELLKANSAFNDVPVMVWSAVHHHLLQPVAGVLNKADLPPDALVNQIRSLLLAKGIRFKNEVSKVSALAKNISVKPSFFGISINAQEALKVLFPRKRWKDATQNTRKRSNSN